jgi:hypothetical protein
LYADGLSEQSLAELRRLVADHWRSITNELVPRVEKMIADDDAAGIGAGLGAGHRVRIGLFSYQVAAESPAPDARPTPQQRPKRSRRGQGDPT